MGIGRGGGVVGDTARQSFSVAADAKEGSAVFQKGLAEKNADARRAYLGGVLMALSDVPMGGKPSSALLAALAVWAEPLLALVRPTLKKMPTGGARSDAAIALCCLHEVRGRRNVISRRG